MPKEDKQFNGKRIIGEKKSKHMNTASESMNNDSDTEAMRDILNTNTESKNDMFLPMKQQQTQVGQMPMMGQQMPMMGQQMPMMGQQMGQQQMNMADVDPIMVNTLAPINNMGMDQMNMGSLMTGAQMAQGLGNLSQLGQSGLNIPQSFEMSEAAQMSQMSQQMGAPQMMGQQLGQMLGQQMGQQMGQQVGQQLTLGQSGGSRCGSSKKIILGGSKKRKAKRGGFGLGSILSQAIPPFALLAMQQSYNPSSKKASIPPSYVGRNRTKRRSRRSF
jgi:hypothetical protein